LKLGLASTHQV